MTINTIVKAPAKNETQKSILTRDEKTRIDPESLEKPIRRRFTMEYKLRILDLADTCTEPGSIGALLRREGLYSSHLFQWRQQREKGMMDGLQPRKRGRKADTRNPLLPEVERLGREVAQLTKRLKQAELIIEVQKKVSQMLETPLEISKSNGSS